MVHNQDNLHVPTSEEAREYGRRGGLASAKARAAREQLRKDFLELLKVPIGDGKIEKVKTFKDFGQKNVSLQKGILMRGLYKAFVDGDMKTFFELCKLAGLTEESVALQVAGAVEVSNPFAGLSEAELLKLAHEDE